MDRDDPGRSRGFGFVTVSGMDLAQEVIRQTDGQDLMVRFVQGPAGFQNLSKYILSARAARSVSMSPRIVLVVAVVEATVRPLFVSLQL